MKSTTMPEMSETIASAELNASISGSSIASTPEAVRASGGCGVGREQLVDAHDHGLGLDVVLAREVAAEHHGAPAVEQRLHDRGRRPRATTR